MSSLRGVELWHKAQDGGEGRRAEAVSEGYILRLIDAQLSLNET